jgi:hypothetical protein
LRRRRTADTRAHRSRDGRYYYVDRIHCRSCGVGQLL